MQFVLVRPEIHEGEDRAAPVVDAYETDVVIGYILRDTLQMFPQNGFRCFYYMPTRQRHLIRKAVHFQSPAVAFPQLQKADRAFLVRFDQFEHGSSPLRLQDMIRVQSNQRAA